MAGGKSGVAPRLVGRRLCARAKAVPRVGAVEANAHDARQELMELEHIVRAAEVRLLVLPKHRMPAVSVNLHARINDKISHLIEVHRLRVAVQSGGRIRLEDGEKLRAVDQ